MSVVIAGAAASVGQVRTDGLDSLIFATARAAIDDAGIEFDAVDGVVTACADQVDGRAISSMVNTGAAGGHLRDEVNIASSGAHALVEGFLAVAAGRCETVLVSAWGKASEGSVSQVEHLSTDPYFDRDLPLNEIAAMGMQAHAFRARVPNGADAARAVLRKSLGADAADRESPVVAAPLRENEVAPYVDGAFALVLTRAGTANGGVAVLGAGWASDRYRLPDRDLVGLPHLRSAAARAYKAARIEGRDAIDFAEVHDYSADAEVLAWAALGDDEPEVAADAVIAGATSLDGPTPVNRSGGSLRGEVPFASGLQKVVGAVELLRLQAGRAVVHMAGGFAGQFQTVVVLGRDGRST